MKRLLYQYHRNHFDSNMTQSTTTSMTTTIELMLRLRLLLLMLLVRPLQPLLLLR